MPRRAKWFRIDNAALDIYGSDLGPSGLAVYMALARHVNGDGVCYPSVATLSRMTGASKRTVQYQLRRLETLGLLRVIGSRGGGRGLTTTYQLMDPNTAAERAQGLHGIEEDKGRTDGTLSKKRVQNTTERVQNTTEKGAPGAPEEDYRTRPNEEDILLSSSSKITPDILGPISAVYAANDFGSLTPLVRRELTGLVKAYGQDEVLEAIKICVRQSSSSSNKKTLAYMGAVLEGKRKDKTDARPYRGPGSSRRSTPPTHAKRSANANRGRNTGKDGSQHGKFKDVSINVAG